MSYDPTQDLPEFLRQALRELEEYSKGQPHEGPELLSPEFKAWAKKLVDMGPNFSPLDFKSPPPASGGRAESPSLEKKEGAQEKAVEEGYTDYVPSFIFGEELAQKGPAPEPPSSESVAESNPAEETSPAEEKELNNKENSSEGQALAASEGEDIPSAPAEEIDWQALGGVEESEEPLSSESLEKALTPAQVVEALDRFIVGQEKAKKAVAIALRNRYRRELLGSDLRDEVIPKNILMVGPTGVGKTEIARRLAKLVGAPFLKVEATKYTEVGYVGRDVESMIRELALVGLRLVEQRRMQTLQPQARLAALERLLDLLEGKGGRANSGWSSAFRNWTSAAKSQMQATEGPGSAPLSRAQWRQKLLAGELNERPIELELEDDRPPEIQVLSAGNEEMGINVQDIFGGLLPKKKSKHKVTIQRAFQLLTLEEARRALDPEEVRREALKLVENEGILFLDELDKVAGREGGHGPDVSRGGVQRDILPIVEGSSVNTKLGPVRTDHILFIAAGAFHESKPSDLIPELQGRFPIRVTLESLRQEDFQRILTEPQNSLTRQYRELLATEGVEVEFTPEGIAELASLACLVNEQTENIGARRLHTLLERVLEEVSFEAPQLKGQKIAIDRQYVQAKLQDIAQSRDLSRFIL